MKIVKNILRLLMLTAVVAGCTEDYDDVSFISKDAAPSNISAIFSITHDNSGLVTIYPSGDNVYTFEIYYGDQTENPDTILAGKNIQHKYPEGEFETKVIAHSAAGLATEKTFPLTVSYRAPENLKVNAAIDADNNFKVNVSASADYASYFDVYFGDIENEVPVSFLKDSVASHIYAAVGTYTIRVVAQSGGAATIEQTTDITIVNPLLLPIDFESSTLAYDFTNFDGGVVTVVDNPYSEGINTSAKVGKMVKNAGQTWGGSFITISGSIDFSTNKYVKMKVYSPRVGAKVLFKVENSSNSGINYEQEVTTTVANEWEELVFDYTGIDANQSYQNIVLIFDNGTMGDGTNNFTFYFDDIKLAIDDGQVKLPLGFESSTTTYTFTDFDGGAVTIIDNPHAEGINTSAKVAQMVKNAGQTWGGSYIALSNPIDFSAGKTFKMKVYSPRVGAKVLLKVENLTDGGTSYEQEVATTVANAWEELTFDYSGIDDTKSYQKVVLIFDNGTAGDGTANFTFLFDDITLN